MYLTQVPHEKRGEKEQASVREGDNRNLLVLVELASHILYNQRIANFRFHLFKG